MDNVQYRREGLVNDSSHRLDVAQAMKQQGEVYAESSGEW